MVTGGLTVSSLYLGNLKVLMLALTHTCTDNEFVQLMMQK